MLYKFTAKVTKKELLTSDVLFLRFDLINPKEINFSAGQYIILEAPTKENQIVRRLYSIASPSTEKSFVELIVKLVPSGIASTYLSNLKIGDQVNFSGPAGLFTFKDNNNPKVFLATGTGIAPIRSMLLTYYKKLRKEKAILLWGLKKKTDIYLEEELKEIQKINNFEYYFCLSREENQLSKPYLIGRIQNNFNILKPYLNSADFYVCGGRTAVEDLKNKLLELGVEKQKLHFEKF